MHQETWTYNRHSAKSRQSVQCIILIPSFLRVMSTVFVLTLGTENHISLDIMIVRSCKIIHGENLDIGLGNYL